MSSVRLGFLYCDNGGQVFQKIDAALFARAAMTLLMTTGRAFEAKCRVATRAKPRYITRVGAALGTLHGEILLFES